MELGKGKKSVDSYLGSFCTLCIIAVVLSYSFQKADIFLNKKDIDMLETMHDMAFDADYVFDFKNGFALAVAFTAYDSNPNPILDPTYGEIVYNYYYWGPTEDGGYETGRSRISTHPCTDEELGLEGETPGRVFMEPYPSSADEVEFHRKKF